MLDFLRTKVFRMAPHADLTSGIPNLVAAPGAQQTSQNSGGKATIAATYSTKPIRDSMSPLFEDNIAAKIIKTAVNGLVDNVSVPRTTKSWVHKC